MFDLTTRLNYKNVPTWHRDICRHSYLADQAGGDNHLDEQKHDLYNESQSLSDILDKESIYVTTQATIDEAQDGENMQNHISLAKMLEVNQEVSTVKGASTSRGRILPFDLFGFITQLCIASSYDCHLHKSHLDSVLLLFVSKCATRVSDNCRGCRQSGVRWYCCMTLQLPERFKLYLNLVHLCF